MPTFAERRRTGREAPIPDFPTLAPDRQGSTHSGPSSPNRADLGFDLLARMMLPMDTAERTLFWEGIVADIVSKGLLRGLSPQRAQEGADDWAQLVAKRLIELEAAVPVAGSA
jgi:hypothetical protein